MGEFVEESLQAVKNGDASPKPRDTPSHESDRSHSPSRSPSNSSLPALKKSSSRSSSKQHRSSRDRDRDASKDRDRHSLSRRRSSRSPERRTGDRHRRRGDHKDRDRSRSPERSRHSRRRSTSRERDRYRSRRHRSSSRDRDSRRRRSPSPYRRPRRRSPPAWRRTTRLPGPERRDVMYFQPRSDPPEGVDPNLTAEEREDRTVFILQLARDTRPTDLEEFFSTVGHVRDVRIITDSRTGRSKGIAYVEFWERESVNLALGLNKQRLLGAPLIIQPSCAERNRQAAQTLGGALGFTTSLNAAGDLNLVVENLHPNIDDKMLLDIFEAFGKVATCKVAVDKNGVSLGYANLRFKNADDAKKVLEQMNGYEIAGRALRIKIEEPEEAPQPQQHERLEKDEKMEIGASGRLHVMAKLAEGSGISVPQATMDAIAAQPNSVPPYATQCFLLCNMFDPESETGTSWPQEVADDVITECNSYGGVLHIYVDQSSKEGNVYVKCASVLVAHNCVNALHGRMFAGKTISANYVPATSYHDLFPDAKIANQPLQTRR